MDVAWGLNRRITVGFEAIATTEGIPLLHFRSKAQTLDAPYYCLQFHPEVTHSVEGMDILRNFVMKIAGCKENGHPRFIY